MPAVARTRRALLAAGLIIAMLCPTACFSQDYGRERWVAREWTKALEHFFPQPRPEVFAAYRFLDGWRHEIPEYSFSITSAYLEPHDMVAEVREAGPESLYKQLTDIYQRNPSLHDHAVQKLLKLDRFRISETKCPALRKQLDDLVNHYRFFGPETPRVDLAGPSEEFWANDGDVGMLFSIDAEGDDRDFPVIAWAREARRILDSCHAQRIKRP